VVQVRQSTIIEAPVDEVWRVLRDFNGHDRWHPAVATSAIDDGRPADMIGAVRRFRLADGGELREQLLSLSDEGHSFTYCILEAPLPLMGYVATVLLKPVTDGDHTFWEWRSAFHPPPHRREELTALVREGIYKAGFEAIRKMFGEKSGRPPLRFASRTTSPPFEGEAGALRPNQRSSSSGFPPPRSGGEVLREARRDGSGSDTQKEAGPSRLPQPITRPTTTRAIVVERHGGPEVLELKDWPLPPPGPGEVTVRHTAIGVNFIDVYCRTGYFDLLTPPGVPGMEAAGVVEARGTGVSHIAVGDRVAYAGPPLGAYSERQTRPAELIFRLPDDILDETAAAGLLKGVAASFLLHDVHPVRPGQTVLVHAAAGGVGQLLVQWARHLGATVIATVSGEEKARIAERLGADHVIVYTRERFPDAVMRITGGRGADVIYDAVGADSFAGSLEALATRGHLVSFGQASGPVGSWDIGRFASKSVTVSRPNYGHFTDTRDKLLPHAERFFDMLRQRRIVMEAPRRYPLAQAADAHRDLEGRRTTGSLILTV
jgi:NADPH:quinone reductase-like Zn-dependent oxidoreductase